MMLKLNHSANYEYLHFQVLGVNWKTIGLVVVEKVLFSQLEQNLDNLFNPNSYKLFGRQYLSIEVICS
jgi:hypothetical protein